MKIFNLITLLLVVTSCNNSLPNKMDSIYGNTEQDHSTHSIKNTLDWTGVYQGILSCKDCEERIKTTIMLNDDNRFFLAEKHLFKDKETLNWSGKFTWDKTGEIISLNKTKYKVGENVLIKLDEEGKEVKGRNAENYILNKTSALNFVGNDADEKGCLASAGYTWSTIREECIRVWEIGKRLEDVENKENSIYIVYNKTSPG